MSERKSKDFVKREIIETGYLESLEHMSFSQLLKLRKELAVKKLEELDSSEDTKSLTKVEIDAKIKEKSPPESILDRLIRF